MSDSVSVNENDAVNLYKNELATVPSLTQEEEAHLWQEMEQPGERGNLAERRLIEGSLHLVLPIVEQHTSSGLSILDLIQEGNLGLIQAIAEFPKKHLDDFRGYAASCIEDAIRGAIANRTHR
jgi:DNA-directed RNA polymerase sigma subunit (sigma70/sigma32)